jgi:hypothetical protein
MQYEKSKRNNYTADFKREATNKSYACDNNIKNPPSVRLLWL